MYEKIAVEVFPHYIIQNVKIIMCIGNHSYLHILTSQSAAEPTKVIIPYILKKINCLFVMSAFDAYFLSEDPPMIGMKEVDYDGY